MPKATKKKNKVKPTDKQKKALKKLLENPCSKKEAFIEAGYSENTAHNPKDITESKGWNILLEEELGDNYLLGKHKGLLEKKETFVIKNNIVKTEQPHTDIKSGLDMAYKLKKKYEETIKLKYERFSDEELEEHIATKISRIIGDDRGEREAT